MVGDPIADFITRLKTAGKARKESVSLPYSKLKEAIAKVLVSEGYLKSLSDKKKDKGILEVVLNYHDNESKIKEVQRISKSSRRVYKGFAEIHPARGGFVKTILSTPKGIMTDRQAVKEKVGGEVLFKIW
ncbi:MAG: 30S ribosomal protein S8 [Candidatus Paceibacterota bacterium]